MFMMGSSKRISFSAEKDLGEALNQEVKSVYRMRLSDGF
jgi:hypothetical protein